MNLEDFESEFSENENNYTVSYSSSISDISE